MNFDGDLHQTSTRNVDNPEWIQAKTRGRWAPYWQPETRTYAPPSSPRRTEARRKKYAWSALTMRGGPEHVDLALCMTGDELLAERGRVRGDGTSFRLQPHTDEACELVALLPHGRLRWCEARLMLALAYAQCERRRPGLVASVDELGAFVGLKNTATGDGLARLVALGWVRADATYTRYGACESQRANLWRLTAQGVAAWGLEVPELGALPVGTADRARLQRRRTYTVGSRACTTPRNPDANPEAQNISGPQKSGSFRNGPRSSEIEGPTTATGAVGPARRQGESAHAPQRAPEGARLSPARAAARAEIARGFAERELRERFTAAARPAMTAAAVRAELADRSAKRRELAADDSSQLAYIGSLASLIADPKMRAAAADALHGPPRVLDDTELRFSMLEPHDDDGGAS